MESTIYSRLRNIGSVVSLIDALEKIPFNGGELKDVAIREAFYEGALRGIKDIVEKFHDHPAVTV